MKKFWLVVLSSALASFGTIDSAKATEPAMKAFSVLDIQKVLVEQDNYKCTNWEWDKSSKNTEVFSRCSQADAEAYIHGNADPLGSQSDSVAFSFVFLKPLTTKSAIATQQLLQVSGSKKITRVFQIRSHYQRFLMV